MVTDFHSSLEDFHLSEPRIVGETKSALKEGTQAPATLECGAFLFVFTRVECAHRASLGQKRRDVLVIQPAIKIKLPVTSESVYLTGH